MVMAIAILRGVIWLLCFATASAMKLGVMSVRHSGKTTTVKNTRGDLVDTLGLRNRVHRFGPELTGTHHIIPVYIEYTKNQERSSSGLSAMAVTSGPMAAAGMADWPKSGPLGSMNEGNLLKKASWWKGTTGPVSLTADEKKEAYKNLTETLLRSVFVDALGGDHTERYQGSCSQPSSRQTTHVGNAFLTGPTHQEQNDGYDAQPFNKADKQLRKGLFESWPKSQDKVNELDVQISGCKPGVRGYVQVPDLLPTGTTVRVSCMPFDEFGCFDQLAAATAFLSHMIDEGKTEGTFTVYDDVDLMAHMRCTVGARPFYYDESDCPWEIPGEKDGNTCVKCPQFDQKRFPRFP